MERKIIRKERHNGIEVIEYGIKNDALELRFINVGGAITKIALAEDAYEENLVCSYHSLADYLDNGCFLNTLIGRTSNRITNGKFTINGKAYQVDLNDGSNNLHGGTENLTHMVFDVSESERGYQLQAVMKEQPEGFPGNLQVFVQYELDDNKVKISYKGLSDKDTLFNPTQHAYFNLSGNLKRSIYEHELMINASAVAEVNEQSSFTEELISVDGTRFDFGVQTIIDPVNKPESDLFDRAFGYDHLFLLDENEPAAVFYEPVSGRKLEIFTSEPAMQFYAGNHLKDEVFENNRAAEAHLGACFETHKVPFDFDSQLLKANEKSHVQETEWVFSKV
ncbi:MAG: galactose mutarotase [Turicibacter sp.]|nr:galactose mutarotase [Turicibacter sp.]